MLLGYWAAMTLVPVPGFGAGNLGKEGSLAAWLDRALLGPAHMWRVSRVYDPEGLLSTIPAIATTLAGVLTGQWLRAGRGAAATIRGLLTAGVAGVALGLLWGRWFPINKSLWTSSYVVFSAGAALLVLAACYWLVEVRGWRRWGRPFEALGLNALAIFFLSGLVAKVLVLVRTGGPDGATRPLQAVLFETVFAPWAAPANASLAFAAATLLLWVGVAWVLYRRDIRLAV
jgi:predicted acyltransferase